MSTTIFPAYAAVFFAFLAALVLLVPFAAIQYRRHGGVTVGVLLTGFVVLLYFVALASYTLLPLPARVANFCEVHQLTPQVNPGQFVADIRTQAELRGGGLSAYLRNPATLQIVFNVALLVPLGMIVRYFAKAPIVITALAGLGASLLIETTQLTGVWFVYPCAYRLFDADDLIANTAGALLGAFLAPALRLLPGRDRLPPGEPRRVTVLRRLLGMAADWLVVSLGGLAVSVVYLVVVQNRVTLPAPTAEFARVSAGILVFSLLQLCWTLATGRTIGETVVRLEPVGHASLGARLLRWLFGIGGYSLLLLLPAPIGTVLAPVAAALSIVLVLVTRSRGLAYAVARLQLQDDRAPEPRGGDDRRPA